MDRIAQFTLWPSPDSAMHSLLPVFDPLKGAARDSRRGAIVLYHLVQWLMLKPPPPGTKCMGVWSAITLRKLAALSQCWLFWAMDAYRAWLIVDRRLDPLFRDLYTTKLISLREARAQYRKHVLWVAAHANTHLREVSPYRPPGHWGPPMEGICTWDSYPAITERERRM